MEKRHGRNGGYNDLYLSEEGSSQKQQPQPQPADYVGFEIETVIQNRNQDRQTKRIAIIFFCLSLLIGIAVVGSRHSNRQSVGNSRGGGEGHHSSSGTGGRGHHLGNPKKNHTFSGGHHSGGHHSGGGIHHHHTPPPSQFAESESSEEVDIDTVVNFWPTSAPLPSFEICKPKLTFKRHQRIAHIARINIVPEAKDDEEDSWEYTFSDLDISDESSIIAVGLSDFSSYTNIELGMVRVFAHACSHRKFGAGKWKQLGQDLLGEQEYDTFGASVSSSLDGTVMAIAATQSGIDDANGYVEVYFLDDEDQNELTNQLSTWRLLGQRIEALEDVEDYYNLGTAIDLSDNGETLGVLGVISESKFVTRVFGFNSNEEKWNRKGHDIVVEIESYNAEFDFIPKITLNKDGTTVSVLDPKFGMIQYDFKFEEDKWTRSDSRVEHFNDEIYTESLSFDESASVVAYSALGIDNATGNNQIMVKLVDYMNGTLNEFYNDSFPDLGVGFGLDVSQDGLVAAVVAYRVNMDDNYQWDYEDVGSLTILSKNMHGRWKILGKGTEEEDMAVPGSMVTLSQDGSIAAIGTNDFIALYGISLNHDPLNMTQTAMMPSVPITPPSDNATEVGSINNTTEGPKDNITDSFVGNETYIVEKIDICAPYPHATRHNVGNILDLPHSNYSEDEHSISLSLSGDGSIVAVGINFSEEEPRGMARVFGYNCEIHNYTRLGQDLPGQEELDGFGQSIDISVNGTVLVVGANQPAPGKAGYVDIYKLVEGMWILDDRVEEMHESVEDIGREVRLSSDGSTVAIHGSFVDDQEQIASVSSFVRVIEKKNDTWIPKGDDLISSIIYDEYGTNVKLAFSAGGHQLGIVGSYNSFSAKLYAFNESLQNWTETIIPPFKTSSGDENNSTSSKYEFDYDLESIFDGIDIALSDDGNTVAIAGTQWSEKHSMMRLLSFDGTNWTLSENAVLELSDDIYTPTAIDISGDATVLAVGLSMEDGGQKGQLSVNQRDNSKKGWKNLGTLDGNNDMDMLGSRVCVSSDGVMVASSSRRGYIALYKA